MLNLFQQPTGQSHLLSILQTLHMGCRNKVSMTVR